MHYLQKIYSHTARKSHGLSTLLGVLFLLGMTAFLGMPVPVTTHANQRGVADHDSTTPLRLLTRKDVTPKASSKLTGSLQSDVAAMGPLRVSSQNGRYFERPDGGIVYLSGSHTWANFQDSGWGTSTIRPEAFDYAAYLDFLQQHNHNFFRLWTWEQTRWSNEASQDDYWFYPQTPYMRTQSGTALDGAGKFDLTTFNQAYFDRLRQRVVDAGARGMYTSVMLFNGWSIQSCKATSCENNPWKGHPYNAANNVNGMSGDVNGNGSGEETQTLASPSITALQEAYVRKVIDTVGDLDNVLYEMSNEGPSNSQNWQYHMIDYIKSYQATRSKQHPVGMTAEWPNGNDTELFNSPADWISPHTDIQNPPVASGAKVILSDTDHLCGICGDADWAWKSFARGENPIFMDGYDGAAYGVGGGGFVPDDPQWVGLRTALGRIRSYADRLDLARMVPAPAVSSTGYSLAKTNGATDDEYLIYAPNGTFTADLTATTGPALSVEWLNTATGQVHSGAPVSGGSTSSFIAPFSGPAVLYLKQLVTDTTPPVVQVTQPAAGSGLSGTVTLMATASDNQAVQTVVFSVDGAQVGNAITQGAYQVPFQTTSLPNGSHTIRATATDSSGNTAYDEVSVTVHNAIATTGLLAAYGFNNPLSPMFDASAHGNHASCTSGHCPAYLAASGRSGGAYSFAGTNNYLVVPGETQFDFTKNMTVSTWMKVNGFTTPWETLVTKGDSAWGLERYNMTNNPDFATFSPAAHDTTGTANIADNTWHHVAATYDGARKKLYVDGNLIANVAYTKTLSTNNLNVWLGFNQEFPAADYGGLLDDVRIYNRALTQAQIQTDKNTAIN